MPYVDPEIIAEVKRVDLLTYLQEREPDELVRISPGVYCTKEHDSPRSPTASGSGGAGVSAAGRARLVKVRDMAFLDAVEHLRADRPAVASIPARACRPTGERAPPAFRPHAGAPTTMRCGTSNRAASRAAC
ncbi:MAG: hypothetical protein ACLT98_06270 [Eggerthellaceae bacterium]